MRFKFFNFSLGKVCSLNWNVGFAESIFYSIIFIKESCTQLQEFLVKKIDRVEVVCMIGVYGLLVSVVQLYPFLLGDMITFTCNKLYTSLCGMIKFPFAFIPLPSFRSTLELKSLESVKWSTDIVSNLFNLSQTLNWWTAFIRFISASLYNVHFLISYIKIVAT